jgi:hypothetical protein
VFNVGAVAIPDEISEAVCLSDERQKTFQVSESEFGLSQAAKDLIRPTASHGPTACLGEKTIHQHLFSAESGPINATWDCPV